MRSFCVGFVVVVLGSAACGKPPPPPPPDPPRISVVPVASSVADTQLQVTVNVSGCDQLSTLGIYEQDKLVLTPTWAGNPTVVQIPANAFASAYAKEIAADLSLTAKVTCADGREGKSTPASVRFLPVAEVVRLPGGAQVVTDVFYAEGQGANTTFVGCSGNPNGTRSWVRVDRTGNIVGRNDSLPFPCSTATWVTEPNLASGKRWAVEPGVGAFAFDAQLTITGYTLIKVTNLAVGPDGDAVVFDAQSGAETVKRISHQDGALKWTFTPAGRVIGDFVVHTTRGVYVPEYVEVFGQGEGTVAVEHVDYANGVGAGRNDLKVITYGLGDAPPIPPAAFNVDGTVLYFPFQTQAGTTTVLACATDANGCAGGALKWTSPTLTGNVALTTTYNQHAIVAAVAPQFAWFLDAQSGAVLNKGGVAVNPEGGLVTMGVQPGKGQDFYLLNGSGAGLPVEVVAVDSPGAGELFRYSRLGSSIMAGVDDSGQVWLRIGNDLVRPMPLAEYALVRVR